MEHGHQFANIYEMLTARAEGEIEFTRTNPATLIDGEVFIFAEGCDLPVYRGKVEQLTGELLSVIGITLLA